MNDSSPFRLGLILRSAPYAQRSPRTQLDVALLAATVDCSLRLFFCGASVMQLAPRGSTVGALLPAAYRGWASLPGFFEHGDLRVFGEPAWLDKMQALGLQPGLPLEPCALSQMHGEWQACDKVLVL